MTKKAVGCLLTTALLSTVPFAQAPQAAKVPRIGILNAASLSVSPAWTEAFRQGLRELGAPLG